MPCLLDYARLLRRMTSSGMICLYPNSGAFGFARGATVEHVGWTGPADPTIRADVPAALLAVAPPYEANLAHAAVRLWQEHLAGEAWLMPMSQWAYELEYGGRGWLGPLLESAGVEVADLSRRNDGSAIVFAPGESVELEAMIRGLLEHLGGSDFMLAFAEHPVLCMIHHHKQLWWSGTDEKVMAAARSML